MDDVEKRLRAIIVDVFKADPKKLKGSTRFVEDLGARSLTMVALIAAVEGEFGITTASTENSRNKTIAQAVAYIKKKIKEKK
jgi:acyl carrier protein